MKNINLPNIGKAFRSFAAVGLACVVAVSSQTVARAAAPSTNLTPVPLECLDDSGAALAPDLSPGWLFVVNFNVAVPGGVRGCMAQSNASGQVSRATFVCAITGSVDVSGGRAVLNGAGYLTCPFNISGAVFGEIAAYDYFWMRARLEPSAVVSTGSEMPLFTHPSAELRATRDDYTVKMTSRLNLWTFSSIEHGQFARMSARVDSVLKDKMTVTHWVNGVAGASASYGNPVFFSTAPTTIQIGRMMTGANVILSELVVDPGGRCCD